VTGPAPSALSFEHPGTREWTFLTLLAAAVLSPNISMPGALPAVRIEQLLLAVALVPLGLFYWRHREYWRVSLVDYAFVALGVATAVTLALAPVFLDAVSFSIRDPFELARVAEYWFLYRLALTVEPRTTLPRAAWLLGALALLMGALALVQYLNPGAFNSEFTSIWTVAHNLDAVERAGRTVGTIGNANYFGAFAGFLAIVPLSLLMLRQVRGREAWLCAAAVFAATFAVVTAQSRTGVLALLFALFVALILVVVRRRGQAAYATTVGLFVVSATVAITFVEVRKPDVGSFSARFAPRGLADDSSLTIRLSRWRSIFAGFLEGGPSFCEGERFENRRIASGHNPNGPTGNPAAGEAATARDEQRKDDVADLTRAVLDFYCDEDEWPVDQPLDVALVPEHLDTWPTDPASGEEYLAYIDRSGFLIGAELEDSSDPEGAVYALGTIPNIASNPSFESGNPPERWRVTGDAAATANGGELFGTRAALVHAPPAGGFFDTVVFDFSRDKDYTAAAWIRPAGSARVTLQLLLVATMADGEVRDPLSDVTVTIEPGAWAQVSLPFRTPEDGRITVLQVILRVPGDAPAASFLVDGATLTQGTFAPGFPRIADTDPSRLRSDELPRFADSPVFGAGPRKDIELGNVDNEYALFLDRYGLLGTVAYLVLFGAAFLVFLRTWLRADGLLQAIALAMTAFSILLAVFNITAGSYYHFQIMAVFWLLAGAIAAARSPGPPLERSLG
jgi:O-antigen ligase